MVYAYTRLLTPAAFGAYTYVFSVALVLQTSLFFALPTAVMRFYPRAALAGRRDSFLKEAYISFYTLAAAVLAIGLAALSLADMPDEYRLAAWLALPMLLCRSAVQINQAVNRSSNRMSRHNTIECLHAVLGFGLGLIALFILPRGSEAIMLGLLIAAVICACIDVSLLVSPLTDPSEALDRKELMRLIDYAWPLVAVAATEVIMQNSDRFLLGSLAGVEMLGIYAIAYNLVERPTSLICLSITTATFSLVLQVMEKQGQDAARIQSGRNGIALISVALPACVGLALTADYIAGSLVGPAFREGVAALIPVMALAAFLRGLRAHFVDHAFHLAGNPLKMLWSYGPATMLNILLNLWAVPRYGMFGAAWTAVACQGVTVIAGWFVGRMQFPLWLPWGQVMRCALAIVPMAAALVLIRFPLGWSGLFVAISMGAAIYTATAIALDVGEIRSIGRDMVVRRLRRKMPVLTGQY